ncbi:UPF0149 family protein [Roseinatronobacter monicus]|uniref:Uncharacterized protein UPF0149 n=1 Tax=Roseinatronobacter monicus TaxID=393481 RepID=A0A543K4B1_9RHOB|nr:UPF0149 family protein [Roseinatronobacter monicus]TQM89864.1 uncharacterized protein UPF0149 [Roseinatronobacter monicus]
MLPHKIQTLLGELPRNLEAHGARTAFKRVAQALMSQPDLAVNVVEVIGQFNAPKDEEERVTVLLSSTLDEARMTRENGKTAGTTFINHLENALLTLKDKGTLSDSGRFALASCWIRAGLVAPEALAGDFAIPDDMQDDFDLSDMPDLGPIIDKMLREVSGGDTDSLSALHAGFSELIATLPAPIRKAVTHKVVARPKPILGELGCALLLDGRHEIRQGALDGLNERLDADAVPSELIGRLTVIRSWVEDDETQSGIDAIVRKALRKGAVPAPTKKEPKIHRAFSSLIDGTGAQSITVAFQIGGMRNVAVVLIKQGFGIKDAYVIPCQSATEQRRLIDMIASQVETRDVPVSYVANAIGLGLSDGLQNGHPPAAGLVNVVQSLGFSELRPVPASIADIVALADTEDQLREMSAQAKGRLITASADWDSQFPMISESWYEDSDSVTDAIEGAKTSVALKRAIWKAFEDRRAHWSSVIARMGHLLHASADDRAIQFAAVARALDEGRDLKKTPIMETIFGYSFQVWLHENVIGDGSQDSNEFAPFEITSGPAPAGLKMPDLQPEKPDELGKLLKPAGLTEWWVDGYLMGVCTAPEFVPPGSWAQVLMNVIGPEIDNDKKLERILELLMLRYNGALTMLRTPIGVSLIPEHEPLISIWADGYLTAWEGNKVYWPESRLGGQDKTSRILLESAAAWQGDIDSFRKHIPNWLRQRFAAQKGIL